MPLCFLQTIKYQNLIKTKNLIKHQFIIYTDIECLIKDIDRCINTPKNLSATKVSGHIPSDFSISTILSFTSIGKRV